MSTEDDAKMPKAKRRLTLSEHLALRAQAAQEAKAREQERLRQIRTFQALHWGPACTCPACMRRSRKAPAPPASPTPKEGQA